MEFTQMPVTIILIALNVIVSLIGFSNPGFVNKLILWPYYIKRNNEYYRMITSGFLHLDFVHLFFNMFTLFFFGRNVEIIFNQYGLGGNISYLLLYFSALIISDISSIQKHKNNSSYRALGASGAVSAVIFAAILFSPWNSIYLFGAIAISATLYAILFIIYCIYMGRKGQDNVNHDAHLWGAIYGLVYALILTTIFNPQLFDIILEQLKHPSLFGN